MVVDKPKPRPKFSVPFKPPVPQTKKAAPPKEDQNEYENEDENEDESENEIVSKVTAVPQKKPLRAVSKPRSVSFALSDDEAAGESSNTPRVSNKVSSPYIHIIATYH